MMLLLFQVMVGFTGANAIALKQNQNSVLYSSKSADCSMVLKRISQSTLIDPQIFCIPSPTNEYAWERGTLVPTGRPVYERADDVLVEKPPRPIRTDASNGVGGFAGTLPAHS